MIDDAAICDLASRAGIASKWEDYAGEPHVVSVDSLKRILAALDLPCGTADDLACSQQLLEAPALPPLVTGTAGKPIDLPLQQDSDRVHVAYEDGKVGELSARCGPRGLRLDAIVEPGYHSIEIGGQRTVLAVAPSRCVTIADVAPGERVWGIAAQVYGLRHSGDCGIGDMAGVAALAKTAAALEADVLALSPLHALFGADPNHYSPYSPSSRLFYNPLHADPRSLFGEERVGKAAESAGVAARAHQLEQGSLVDWPQSADVKLAIYRRLFADFTGTDLSAAAPKHRMAADFGSFRAAGGKQLEDHVRFEALHAAMLGSDRGNWNWRDWPVSWRDPRSQEVTHFAERNESEVSFQFFLQWIAERSIAAAQRTAKQAGMRSGLLADLAVGMSNAGSHAWANQKEILAGLEIGAPPDLYNTKGQNWGLTTFSPRALSSGGFAPFIATLRACLRHSGGLRIDHAMGLLRLWVIPQGADAKEGAYLAFPIDDLMRLVALESHRQHAIVIGEDLGTVPPGFRDRLGQTGIYGMRVLWFERENKRFTPPAEWSTDSVAMTSTHDLPTVAGWWGGKDIEARNQLGLVADIEAEEVARAGDRRSLWRAFRRARAGAVGMPPPADTAAPADAAVKFIAETSSQLALLPLEDALALQEQPNLPGTIDEYPNWRRRYRGEAGDLLKEPQTRRRLEPLTRRVRP
jgi:4-alpha-glucanotransferase